MHVAENQKKIHNALVYIKLDNPDGDNDTLWKIKKQLQKTKNTIMNKNLTECK